MATFKTGDCVSYGDWSAKVISDPTPWGSIDIEFDGVERPTNAGTRLGPRTSRRQTVNRTGLRERACLQTNAAATAAWLSGLQSQQVTAKKLTANQLSEKYGPLIGKTVSWHVLTKGTWTNGAGNFPTLATGRLVSINSNSATGSVNVGSASAPKLETVELSKFLNAGQGGARRNKRRHGTRRKNTRV